MKRIATLLLAVVVGGVLLSTQSCTDKCEVIRTFRTQKQLAITLTSIRAGVKVQSPRELERPAKMYVKDNYIFISEAKKGVHVIDNSNPSAPVKVSFLEIPGVIDLAVKENTLYVDSYLDVVALDISDPKAIKEVGRNKNIFKSGLFEGLGWYFNEQNQTVYDSEWETVTQTTKTDCGANFPTWGSYHRGGFYEDFSFSSGAAISNSSSGKSSPGAGTGGSTARFTVYKDFLYTLSQKSMTLFNISNQQQPDSTTTVQLGQGIETIFPYQDKLFIGSNTGMYIYDNSDPANPVQLSIFNHARACDPVVVEGSTAYVTLRQSFCGQSPNQLDIVNISDLRRPSLIKSYTMENPHGLGVNNGQLFVCEGAFGLKSINVTDPKNIRVDQFIKNINAFDVIPLTDRLLLMVGEDGFYQYDYSDPRNLRLLSKIDVRKP